MTASIRNRNALGRLALGEADWVETVNGGSPHPGPSWSAVSGWTGQVPVLIGVSGASFWALRPSRADARRLLSP